MADQEIPKSKMDEILAYVVTNKPDDIKLLLDRNGFQSNGLLSLQDVQIAFLKALKDSKTFRDDVSGYLAALVQDNEQFVSQPNLNFGPDFSNTAGAGSTDTATTTNTTPAKTGGTFWSSLGGVLNKDNLSKLFNTGLDTVSNKLKNDANKASEERALELERLRLQQIQAQKDLQGSGSPSAGGSKMPGWGIALIVVGSLALVGTTIYLIARKKK